MNIRCGDLHGILEQGLQQLDDRRIGLAFINRQLRKIEIAFAQFFAQLFRQRGDFFRAAIDQVDGHQQIRFAYQHGVRRLLQQAVQFVEREDISRVGHADGVMAGMFFQYQRAIAACIGLRQDLDDLGLETEMLQVKEGNIQLLRKQLQDLVFMRKPQVDNHPPELAPGTFLFRQRFLQLLFRNDSGFHQQVAKPDFLMTLDWR